MEWSVPLEQDAYMLFQEAEREFEKSFLRMDLLDNAERLGVDIDKYNPMNDPEGFDRELAQAREAAEEAERDGSSSEVGGGAESRANRDDVSSPALPKTDTAHGGGQEPQPDMLLPAEDVQDGSGSGGMDPFLLVVCVILGCASLVLISILVARRIR